MFYSYLHILRNLDIDCPKRFTVPVLKGKLVPLMVLVAKHKRRQGVKTKWGRDDSPYVVGTYPSGVSF